MDTDSFRWYTRIKVYRVFRPIYLVLGLLLSLSACQNSCCGCGGPTPGTIAGIVTLTNMSGNECEYAVSPGQGVHIEVTGEGSWGTKPFDFQGSVTNSYSIQIPDKCNMGITVSVTVSGHSCSKCTTIPTCERFTGSFNDNSNRVANKTYTVEVKFVDCNC
jgi:hypothetical protein